MSESAPNLPVAGTWFSFEEIAPGLVRITEPHVHELIQANSYLLAGRSRDLLIDGGLGVGHLRTSLDQAGLLKRPIVAVATHAHYDHVGSMHEFSERLIHPIEADWLADATDDATLCSADFPQDFLDGCAEAGMPLPHWLISAVPWEGYDPREYHLRGAAPTGTLEDGDVVDLGDRQLSVLHLPGHSPGSIGLLDETDGTLFAGDAIYDGALLDEGLPGSSIAQYLETMARLRQLEPTVVHGGHYDSFDAARLHELADAYIELRNGAASASSDGGGPGGA